MDGRDDRVNDNDRVCRTTMYTTCGLDIVMLCIFSKGVISRDTLSLKSPSSLVSYSDESKTLFL